MWEDIFLRFFRENRYFCLDFKNGGVPPPHFQQIGGLPLYTKQLFTNTIISKGG